MAAAPSATPAMRANTILDFVCMTHLLCRLKQTVKPLAFQACDHPTYDVDARPKKGSVFESVLADSIPLPVSRDGKLGTSRSEGSFGQNTRLRVWRKVRKMD